MDAFPEDYTVHNLPLIILSGLEGDDTDAQDVDKSRTLLQDGGFRVNCDLPALEDETAQQLRQTLLAYDSSGTPWNGRRAAQEEHEFAYHIRSIGRAYTLPPRKAPPPPHSPRLRPLSESGNPSPMVLHSVLSPLSPGSPLYPDGLITPLWANKHQSRLPSIFISFFNLVCNQNTSTLQDNKLKAEIHNIRSIFNATNYRTKLIVVLIADDVIDTAESADRINNIRRATGFDSKTLFFLPASASPEINEFARALLSNLYAASLEYYRELSKHARRKRNRNSVPQPTVQPTSGTSQTLSLQAWNVRYEFKLAVFAEFRQEMDAANRNYEVAYDILFGPELFDAIPSWSPRFNEARLLADVIAIRGIRCLLWAGQTTNAVKWWCDHRDRVRDLVDRRGAGTENYGWESWQCVWSKTMAKLIERTQVLPVPDLDDIPDIHKVIMIHSEKTLPTTDSFAPWESLHHEGYWLNLAQRHTQNRRARALEMPEEDRASPGQSPASAIASRAHLYDKYLAPEPYNELPTDGRLGFDYGKEILECLEDALRNFSERGQIRMTRILKFKKALELMRSSAWIDALSVLLPLWQDQTLRRGGWWSMIIETGNAVMLCATQTGDLETIKKVNWELSHPLLKLRDASDPELLSATVDSGTKTLTRVAASTESSLSRIVPTFAFASDEGFVGRPITAQLTLRCLDAPDVPHALSDIKVVFEGGLKPFYLLHDTDEADTATLSDVQIRNVQLAEFGHEVRSKNKRSSISNHPHSSGLTHLVLGPGQTKVYRLELVPREAGEVSVASITLSLKTEDHEMAMTTPYTALSTADWWELRNGQPVPRLYGSGRDVSRIMVLPKPPKLDIEIPALRKTYYTNEDITLEIEVSNQEEEAISGIVEARFISASENTAILKWDDHDGVAVGSNSEAGAFVQTLPSMQLTGTAAGASTTHTICITRTDDALDHELEIIVPYTLHSSPENQLTKLLTVDVPIIRPFEANFAFHPRCHNDNWPDYFSASSVSRNPVDAVGIKQQYLVSALICSFAVEDIEISAVNLISEKVVGDAVCSTTKGVPQSGNSSAGVKEITKSVILQPEQTKRFTFDMVLQKLSLGNRQPVAADLLLNIEWKRSGTDEINTSTLALPRFLASSSEPRVLLQSMKDLDTPDLYNLTYTIENPSLHFLTFNITMESSEDFAFSGHKMKTLNLVPVSRLSIQYRLMPNKRKDWVKVHLEVVDAYFGQTLKVQPAGEGIRLDKAGNLMVRFA